jgi:Rod binding domain-containing protein
MSTGMIGPGAVNAQISVQQAQESQALQQINSARGTNDDAKIAKGAQQFEAMLLSSWLQQAEKSFATVAGADDDNQDAAGGDQMMSLGVQSLAESMAASGGIGIGKMIAKAMHASAEKADAAAANADAGATTGAAPAPPKQILGGNLSFRLNSRPESADSVADSEKRSK